MNVAMVSEHASPLATLGGVDAGGQNVHVAELAAAMAGRGVTVTVYTRRDDPNIPRSVPFRNGVTVEHIDAGPPRPIPKDEMFGFMDAFSEDLGRAWDRQRPDIVHAHFWMSGSATLDAAIPRGIPVVQTFHALGVVKRRQQGRKDTSPAERIDVERRLIRDVDRIVATCTDEVFELARLGAEYGRATVIPCGVDLSLFRPDGPRWKRTAGRHRLAVVSRLVERKGIGNLVSALPNLPDVELLVAGGGEAERLEEDPEAARLRRLAQEVGVAGRVRLLGRVDREEVPALMRSADAVVCAPWYEPFGMAAVEAMACGVPVVASAVGGLIDTVVDGVTGVHVPPRDTEALAEAISGLLADPGRRAALGRGGATRARSRYGWDRVATSTLDLYREVLASRSPLVPAPGQTRRHLDALRSSLDALAREGARIEAWGRELAEVLLRGGRLLVAGNGGSAAQAQHLTAELVGRYREDRRPLSAIALHAETSSVTAIANDYGSDQVFARQVTAHGRQGDVLLCLSTSGRSENVLRAVEAARALRLRTWGLTGPGPNPLAARCHESITLDAPTIATVQELHLAAIHVLAAAVDQRVREADRSAITPVGVWR